MVEGTPIDREKLLSLHVGRPARPAVREGRDERTGIRWKSTTDELSNTVTEHADDRQDVTVRAPRVAASTAVREESH